MRRERFRPQAQGQLRRASPTISLAQTSERAILAGFERRRGAASASAGESFAELKELALSAGAIVVSEVFQTRPDVNAATLFGQGKWQNSNSWPKLLKPMF